jgi:hypothetical protein
MSTVDHAFLAPSSAHRWVVCAASPAMAVRYPEMADTIDSQEGTAAHWAASELLYGRNVAVGQIALNNITLNQEMIDAAELYVSDILPFVNVHIEERTTMYDSINPNNWGTPDAWVMPDVNFLIVWDFKYGHDFVDVFENWQLINYAAGILEQLGIDGHQDQRLDVEFRICQPRNYHRDGMLRTWRVKASALRAMFNQLRNAAEAAMKPNPIATVSPNGCKHCPGRHACEPLQHAGYDAVVYSRVSTPHDLSPTALGLEARMLKDAQRLLDARIAGLDAQIEAAIAQGVDVPYFGMKPTQSRKFWIKSNDQVAALGDLMGVNVRKPVEILTPVQAIKAGLPSELIANFTGVKSGLKLEELDDKEIRKIFY